MEYFIVFFLSCWRRKERRVMVVEGLKRDGGFGRRQGGSLEREKRERVADREGWIGIEIYTTTRTRAPHPKSYKS